MLKFSAACVLAAAYCQVNGQPEAAGALWLAGLIAVFFDR